MSSDSCLYLDNAFVEGKSFSIASIVSNFRSSYSSSYSSPFSTISCVFLSSARNNSLETEFLFSEDVLSALVDGIYLIPFSNYSLTTLFPDNLVYTSLGRAEPISD